MPTKAPSRDDSTAPAEETFTPAEIAKILKVSMSWLAKTRARGQGAQPKTERPPRGGLSEIRIGRLSRRLPEQRKPFPSCATKQENRRSPRSGRAIQHRRWGRGHKQGKHPTPQNLEVTFFLCIVGQHYLEITLLPTLRVVGDEINASHDLADGHWKPSNAELSPLIAIRAAFLQTW